MDVDNTQGPWTLRMITNGQGYRRWNIQVTQIECSNPSKAPANCLQVNTVKTCFFFTINVTSLSLSLPNQYQYFVGPSGTFSSFNYETSHFQDYSPTTQQTFQNPALLESTYINGLDYSVCFRKESGFCTQTYSVNSTLIPFEIVNYGPSKYH